MKKLFYNDAFYVRGLPFPVCVWHEAKKASDNKISKELKCLARQWGLNNIEVYVKRRTLEVNK